MPYAFDVEFLIVYSFQIYASGKSREAILKVPIFQSYRSVARATYCNVGVE